jgi:diacylglycerol kinase family enzyme
MDPIAPNPPPTASGPTEPTQDRPRLRKIQAVVNAASGSVGPNAAKAVEAAIAAHGYDLTMATPGHGELEGAIQAAVDAAPDLVVILGGDGTARLAAERCGPDGPLLAALPGGTLNMLPHVLYGPLPWAEALEAALTQGVERPICGGRVNDQLFFVAAVLGAPALWSAAREAVRAGDLRRAWRKGAYALRRAFTGRIQYGLDGRPASDAEALVLISPTVSKAIEGAPGLEVAEIDAHNAAEMFGLAFRGLAGDWRADPNVKVNVAGRGGATARRPIPCILDGELTRMPNRVEFSFQRKAFRALALPGDHGSVL